MFILKGSYHKIIIIVHALFILRHPLPKQMQFNITCGGIMGAANGTATLSEIHQRSNCCICLQCSQTNSCCFNKEVKLIIIPHTARVVFHTTAGHNKTGYLADQLEVCSLSTAAPHFNSSLWLLPVPLLPHKH